MAIQGKSEIRWIWENCLRPELLAIREDNKFYSNVDDVVLPEYTHFLEDKDAVWGAIEGCLIQAWIEFIHHVGGMIGGDGKRSWAFDVVFIGGVRGDKTRLRAIELAEDHKRVMDANPARDQQGGTVTNTWGRNTQLVQPYDFQKWATAGIGAWECTWRVEYSQPHHPSAE